MADNVDVTEGAGKTIATDDVGGSQYQRVKLDLGTDGAAAPALAGTGVMATGVQRVTIATDDPATVLLGTIDADTGAIKTSVEIMDDWDESDRAKVNLVVGQAGITANAGAVGASTPRVTLASDDPAVALLTTIDSDTNTIQSDTTAIKTAVEIIDDWDATHDSAASADGVQLMAAYDSTKPTAVADGDAVRVLSDQYGRPLAGVEPTRWQAVFDSADASAEANVVHASAASTIVVVQSYIISSDTELWVKLQDEDSTALTGKFWLKAGGGVAITLPDKAPIVLGVDKDLEVITEGAGDVSVSATGYTIPG